MVRKAAVAYACGYCLGAICFIAELHVSTVAMVLSRKDLPAITDRSLDVSGGASFSVSASLWNDSAELVTLASFLMRALMAIVLWSCSGLERKFVNPTGMLAQSVSRFQSNQFFLNVNEV